MVSKNEEVARELNDVYGITVVWTMDKNDGSDVQTIDLNDARILLDEIRRARAEVPVSDEEGM